MAAYNVELRKNDGSAFADLFYPKTTWAMVEGKPSTYTPTTHNHQGKDISDASPVYFVTGNTSGTVGYWTGTIPNVSDPYEGLTILYKIGIAGSSTDYLNINGWGDKIVYRYSTSKLTTHFGVNYIVMLTYTTLNGGCWMVNSDYDSTDPYTDRYNQNHTAGETIYAYKIVMEGVDGKIYPLTLENGTGTTKTVSTQEMRVGGELMIYVSTGTINTGSTTRYYMASRWTGGVLYYTANVNSGWTTDRPIYVVGSINANGNFVLDNSSYTAFLTQTLPTTDDGKIYIFIGYMNNTSNEISFHEHQTWYQFRDGKLRQFVPVHKHIKADITDYGSPLYSESDPVFSAWNKSTGISITKSQVSDFPASMPASDVYAWAKAASKPAYTYSEVGAAASGHNHSGVYEPVFSKNTAFNKNFGTAVGTVCQGNDSRLSDARTPVSHATDDDSYGLGDSDYYGHCLIINHLLRSVQQDGEALSAYQGYILKGLVDGKAADDHTQAVTKGGTGLTSIAIGEMLYASGANVIAKVASSSFGRGLLNASTGVMVSGLNANTLAGYGHSDFRKTSEAVFRSIKDWTTYVSTNGSTAVALPTTESVSDRLIGVVLNTSTSSTYQRTVVWIKISSTSGTTYRAAFNLGSVGQDSSTSSIYIYEAEFYQSSGVLYIDDATRTSLTPGSPVNGTKVSTSTDINIWDIYVLD